MRTPRRSAWVVVAIAAWPLATQGQKMQEPGEGPKLRTLHETQIADLREMKGKYASLAEAISVDLWDWRPMEGVRSVRDVMALAAAEAYLFPTMWGFEAPAHVRAGFTDELARLGDLRKPEVIDEINMAFDHFIGIVENMSGTDRYRETTFFGRTVDVQTAIMLAATDMHEHLGQAIAYARTNHVVPPWSRRDGGNQGPDGLLFVGAEQAVAGGVAVVPAEELVDHVHELQQAQRSVAVCVQVHEDLTGQRRAQSVDVVIVAKLIRSDDAVAICIEDAEEHRGDRRDL